MKIRLATPEDTDQLFMLNTLYGQVTTKKCMRDTLCSNSQEIVCIAMEEETAVGFCTGLIIKSMCYSANRGDVESLFVQKEYRKQGIGEALLRFLETQFVSMGITHFHLTTRIDNIPAQKLYEKIGYVDTKERFYEKDIYCT